jgi:2-amino-4-hydroxy-6-hydroxymethyldihydropteridine diphosphokinase
MKVVYLSLGSNLGDRQENLARALRLIGESGIRILRPSAVYETEPQGFRDQPRFLNQVIEAQTPLFPRQLLSRVKKIEREMGRKPAPRNTARIIDIDILLYGQAAVKTEDLEIPHPRMEERRFVLEPLAELVPDLRHPVTRRSVRDMLAAVRDQGVRRL